MKRFIQVLLERFGFHMMTLPEFVTQKKTLETNALELAVLQKKLQLTSILLGESAEIISQTLIHELSTQSRSQIGQDVFVLKSSHFKREGYFVEFGATNGIDLSNTYMLEKHYGWKGIVAEPARTWHADLLKNRDCVVVTDCVWSESGIQLEFSETAIRELSTLSTFKGHDFHSDNRHVTSSYHVKTVTLEEMLEAAGAPTDIDFLSIDTEGSEFDILNHFDFTKYKLRVICVEHNYTPNREMIFSLLTQKGFTRVHEDISQFDDWYISNSGR